MVASVQHVLTVPAELAGQRLDQALAEMLSEYSRTRLKEWIESGHILVDGVQRRPKDRVIGGERVEVRAEIAAPITSAPESIELDVAYEDRHVFVINKPAGLVVHPGAGNPAGTLLNALLNLDSKLKDLPRAGIVHRLDKETSGLLVVARTAKAHTELVRALEAREVEREYEAVCVGVLTSGGTVDAPIGRHPIDRVRMAVRADGREAITHYRVIRRFRAHTHVRVQLETGRTHQIRVHFAHIRYPLLGDRLYGGRLLLPKSADAEVVKTLRAFPRQALHAARLQFAHPMTGKAIECRAELPRDMHTLLMTLSKDSAAHGV